MNILVTGGAGFIGSTLVERLVKEDANVIVYDNMSSGNELNLKNVRGSVKIIVGDVRDKDFLEKVLSKNDVSCVFHLAAAMKHATKNEKEFFGTNVDGTKNVLMLSKELGIKRFIHCSTVGVYGSHGRMISETSPYNPSDPYEKSKCEGEKIAVGYMKDLDLTIIQPSIVYGPRHQGGFYKMIKNIKRGTFFLVGDGSNEIQLAYVGNVVDGLILSFKKRKSIGKRYIIADKEPVSMLKIAQRIANCFNKKIPSLKIPKGVANLIVSMSEGISKFGIKPVLTKKNVEWLTENYTFNTKKAERELGYKPKITFDEGIKLTIEWYKENGWL